MAIQLKTLPMLANNLLDRRLNLFDRRTPDAGNPLIQHSATALLGAYRLYGLKLAHFNPLNFNNINTDPRLSMEYYGLSDKDLTTIIHAELGGKKVHFSLGKMIKSLQAAYCGPIGLDAAHVQDPQRSQWLHMEFENRYTVSPPTHEECYTRIIRLIGAEELEKYFAEHFPSMKRFSIEGCEAFIVAVCELFRLAALTGVEEIVSGMAHRGRINALINLFGVPPAQMKALCAGEPIKNQVIARDLKYHMGAYATWQFDDCKIDVALLSNPSHLESICPVILGYTRARQERRADHQGRRVLPLLVHGDAAFAGQGVVMETLNLTETPGYRVGGTVHLIINNQIGFTTSDPHDARSSIYASDVARMIDAPILHVNANDPDAVCETVALALRYRYRFGADIVIDLVGYRRHGHNEQDDPTVTQPSMYRSLTRYVTVAESYASSLIASGVLRTHSVEKIRNDYRTALGSEVPISSEIVRHSTLHPSTNRAFNTYPWDLRVDTTLSPAKIRELGVALSDLPKEMSLHADVVNLAQRWHHAVNQGQGFDWGLAEALAFASLLEQGYRVRLSGIDSGRGTFHHRYARWHNQAHHEQQTMTHIPLARFATYPNHLNIVDSPLTEKAVLGFEYGYSLNDLNQLVIWEAQYGDFVNCAQTIIDQYISSGEAKWDLQSGLVMYLPHGYEGVGPEHSSAFINRFLWLCAQDNMQVCMPSNAAQMFHLLRRQALSPRRKPLIIFTPKSSLFATQASWGTMQEFTEYNFRPVLEDMNADPAHIERVIIASGKLVYDLLELRHRSHQNNCAIVGLEQLYPFPSEQLITTFARYPKIKTIVLASEEAENHSAWHPLREQLEAIIPTGVALKHVSRPASAMLATCSAEQHRNEQNKIVELALKG